MIPPVDRDDELDALLGALGNPAGSTPLTSADRILAMAAPPVVVPLPKPGIPRWVLGGSIAAATMFGFVGGAAAMYLAGGLDRAPQVADTRVEAVHANTNVNNVATHDVLQLENNTAVATSDAFAANEAEAVATLSTSDVERVPPPGVGGSSASQGEASLSARTGGGATTTTPHATRRPAYQPVAIRTIHEVAPLAPGIVGEVTKTDEAVATAGTPSTRPRFVGSPVGLGGHGSRPSEDPFASIPFDDAPDETVATARHDADRRAPHASAREEVALDEAPRKGSDRARPPAKAVTRPEAVAQVARGRSPFSLAFDLGGRSFAVRGERGATGLSTGANVRLDLAHGAVRPVLEAGLDAGAGLFPGVGPLAFAPHLGAELELAVGAFAPSVGWTVTAPLPRPDERLALFTGPTVGLDIGRQDRPHFRARLDVELPTDPMMDAVVDANVAVSGGVEIPLGTW